MSDTPRTPITDKLKERAAWIRGEYLAGGNFEHLSAREQECTYIAHTFVEPLERELSASQARVRELEGENERLRNVQNRIISLLAEIISDAEPSTIDGLSPENLRFRLRAIVKRVREAMYKPAALAEQGGRP